MINKVATNLLGRRVLIGWHSPAFNSLADTVEVSPGKFDHPRDEEGSALPVEGTIVGVAFLPQERSGSFYYAVECNGVLVTLPEHEFKMKPDPGYTPKRVWR